MAIDQSAFKPEDLTAFKNVAAKEGASTAMINYYRANFNLLNLFNLPLIGLVS